MLQINTILHPTDFSQHSAGAFHLACALARDHRAQLVLLHVATQPPLTFSEAGFPPPMDAYKDALAEKLQTLEDSADHARLSHRLEEGEPAEEILRVAALCDADLIVMGTHGRRGPARLLMGSIAERVVRKAPCPVLTLRSPCAWQDSDEESTVPAMAAD